MAFSDFTFPQVLRDLGLAIRDEDFVSPVPAAAVDPLFQQMLDRYVPLALSINTEKARAEFAIAPVLGEVKRLGGDRVTLFSGVPLDADAARGLSGVLDFVLARSPTQFVLTAPLVTVVEAKNANPATGMGQCIAGMYAARLVNEKAGRPAQVYGVSTTGTEWRFLRLDEHGVAVNPTDLYIDNLGKLLGILLHIVRTA